MLSRYVRNIVYRRVALTSMSLLQQLTILPQRLISLCLQNTHRRPSWLVAMSATALLLASAGAHMEISSPPPRRSRFGPGPSADIDYNMMAPLPADGTGLPCKGYAAATPVTKLRAGSTFNVTAYGATFHGGGEC
jgi:hypothetical protein